MTESWEDCDARHWMGWLRRQAKVLGFSHIGIARVDLEDTCSNLEEARVGLQAWLEAGFAGEMHYMQHHATLRTHPQLLVKSVKSIITARMDYLPESTLKDWQTHEWRRLSQAEQAVVSLYARGRDYHKVLRQRLQRLAKRLNTAIQETRQKTESTSKTRKSAVLPAAFAWRAFTDSAPILEVELAQKSGLAWRGKHTLGLSREGGSMFFLGEIFCNLALPQTLAISAHCGSCSACIAVCPTRAIVGPGQLDARRCISYLTIEHRGSIDPTLRPLMGNRVYGCDDCQLVCPWNRFAKTTTVPDFAPREAFVGQTLLHYFAWDEAVFLQRTQGSAIYRIGHAQWLRNVAIALGNLLRQTPAGLAADQVCQALARRQQHPSPIVREHVQWALAQKPLPP